MTINETVTTSTFLFSDTSDSKIRFGIEDNGTEYSKSAQPSQDVFTRRIARLYNIKTAYSNKAENIIEPLLMALASGNEKIAVSATVFSVLNDLIISYANSHCIRLVLFEDIKQLKSALKNGVKAVIISTSAVNCCTVNTAQAGKLCCEYNIPLIVDNTLTTALTYNPFVDGADFVLEMSQLVSVNEEKNLYITLLEKTGFDWLRNNRYSKLFPYRNSPKPVTAFIKSKCKAFNIENNKAIQAEYFSMCEGLRTLNDRIKIHSNNSKFIAGLLSEYCTELSYNFINNKNSICLTVRLMPELCDIVKEKLLPVTIYRQERLYSMYSCTAVYFDNDVMHIKAGTEPVGYLKQIFSIM